MKTIAPDLRVAKTMKKLESALFHLLSSRPLDEISVKMLCQEASVNRSTFYAYFRSISELLDYFNEQYIKKFHQDILKQWDSVKGIRNYYLQLLQYIRDNKTIFYCLYVCGHAEFMERTLPLAFEDLVPCMKTYPSVSKKDQMFVRIFNIYGCNGLIKFWLLHNCEEPVEEMAEHLFRYTMRILAMAETWQR